jgi:hypothetical protein
MITVEDFQVYDNYRKIWYTDDRYLPSDLMDDIEFKDGQFKSFNSNINIKLNRFQSFDFGNKTLNVECVLHNITLLKIVIKPKDQYVQ